MGQWNKPAVPKKADPGGNALAALCSFFLPGLGQLVQGRTSAAVGHFFLCLVGGVLTPLTCGVSILVVAAVSCLDAARYEQ